MKKTLKLEGRDYLEIENLERPDNTLHIWFYEFVENKTEPDEPQLIIISNNKLIDFIIELHAFYDEINPKEKSKRRSFELLEGEDKNKWCFIGKTEEEAMQHAEKFLIKNNLTTYKRSIENYFIANVWIEPKEKKGDEK